MSLETLKAAMDSAKSARDGVFSGAEGDAAPIALLKTAYSKNITIEEWNQLVVDMDVTLRELSADSSLLTAVYSTVSQLCNVADDYYDLKENAFTGYTVNRALADSLGNIIDETYETKDHATAKLTGVQDGTYLVGKAYSDEDGLRFKTGYAKISSDNTFLSRNTFESLASFTAGIDVKTGIYVTSGNAAFLNVKDGATTTYFLLPEDRSITYYTLATEEYVNAKVTKANLTTVLGLANYVSPGLMGTNDKSRLDALYALLGNEDDSDEVVNTINEVLAIFNQYPEGATLLNALALKIPFSAIIDNLASNETSKPLSAYQGKVLNDRLEEVEENYVDHDDVFAAAMFTVTDYDQSSGEITLEYSSSAITDITYNSSTGQIVFTY